MTIALNESRGKNRWRRGRRWPRVRWASLDPDEERSLFSTSSVGRRPSLDADRERSLLSTRSVERRRSGGRRTDDAAAREKDVSTGDAFGMGAPRRN